MCIRDSNSVSHVFCVRFTSVGRAMSGAVLPCPGYITCASMCTRPKNLQVVCRSCQLPPVFSNFCCIYSVDILVYYHFIEKTIKNLRYGFSSYTCKPTIECRFTLLLKSFPVNWLIRQLKQNIWLTINVCTQLCNFETIVNRTPGFEVSILLNSLIYFCGKTDKSI